MVLCADVIWEDCLEFTFTFSGRDWILEPGFLLPLFFFFFPAVLPQMSSCCICDTVQSACSTFTLNFERAPDLLQPWNVPAQIPQWQSLIPTQWPISLDLQPVNKQTVEIRKWWNNPSLSPFPVVPLQRSRCPSWTCADEWLGWLWAESASITLTPSRCLRL